MFGFLKDKLKKAVQVFTKATTEEVKPEVPAPKPAAKPTPKPAVKPAKEPAKPVKHEKETPKAKPHAKPDVKHPAKAEPKSAPAPIPTPEPLQAKPSAAELLAATDDELEDEDEVVAPRQHAPPAHQPVHAPKSHEAPTHGEPRQPVLKVEQKEEKGGFFDRLKAAITTKKLERAEYDNLFSEIEIDLLENNVALEVVDKIKEDLWLGLSTERFSRFSPEKRVSQALHESLQELFLDPFDILAAAKKKDLYIICAVGVNGSGKTTTMAKLAKWFKDNKLPPVLAACDTFRAAAIQQLEEHAKRIDVPIIKQQYGADAAAVAFDAIQYARAHNLRVVLIDTAGRLHSNTNLMEELKKIVRVAKPDVTIFIGEATTGNDCVEQALEFQKAVDIDGIVLSKVDVDERGGAALSISYVTRRPILFFGTGQRYEDIEPFDKKRVLESLEA